MTKPQLLDDLPRHAADALVDIAARHLGIETLAVRGRDALDFHDCGVAGIRDALIAAYQAGAVAALDAMRSQL